MFLAGLLIGVFVGGIVGVFVMALCVSAGRADQAAGRE